MSRIASRPHFAPTARPVARLVARKRDQRQVLAGWEAHRAGVPLKHVETLTGAAALDWYQGWIDRRDYLAGRA